MCLEWSTTRPGDGRGGVVGLSSGGGLLMPTCIFLFLFSICISM